MFQQTEYILDALVEHVVYHDMEMTVLWANRAACQSVALKREQVIGHRCYEIWPRRAVPCADCPVKLSRETGLPQTAEMQTPDGRHWHIGASPVFDTHGHIIAMVELTMDISDRVQAVNALKHSREEQEQLIHRRTRALMSVNEQLKKENDERRKIERQLRESEERFRKIFENAVIGIAIADWEGRLEHCNPAYCKLLGYSEEELQQIKLEFLIHPEDKNATLLEMRRLKNGELSFFEIENRCLHKDGHPVWVNRFVSILRYERNKPPHLLVLVNDVSVHKQAKEQLDQLNQALVERSNLAEQRAFYIQQLAIELSKAEDRERQRLASVLHDDLQQMLAYLKIKLTSLQANVDLAADIYKQANLIDQCIDRCRNLAHELKPYGPKQNDFLGAIQLLVRQMKEMYGLEVVFQASADPGILSSVLSSLLIRSIRELLFNVVKHSGVKRAEINLRIDGNQMLITIKDAGNGCNIGILTEKREKNTAFGLFAIEDRVSFLGGSMHIESDSGKGFCVTLWVPRVISCSADQDQPTVIHPQAPQQRPEVPAIAVGGEGAGRSIRVLLADDHQIMRDGLSELINAKENIDVMELAANGREAVELALKLRPDVILMDVSMPILDGIEATRQIKASCPEIHVIGLTMHKDPEVHKAMRDAGACLCLLKSGSPDKLIATVRSLFSDPMPISPG